MHAFLSKLAQGSLQRKIFRFFGTCLYSTLWSEPYLAQSTEEATFNVLSSLLLHLTPMSWTLLPAFPQFGASPKSSPFPSSSPPSPSHLSKSQFYRSSNRIPPRPTRGDRRQTGGERAGEVKKKKRSLSSLWISHNTLKSLSLFGCCLQRTYLHRSKSLGCKNISNSAKHHYFPKKTLLL